MLMPAQLNLQLPAQRVYLPAQDARRHHPVADVVDVEAGDGLHVHRAAHRVPALEHVRRHAFRPIPPRPGLAHMGFHPLN